jgi:hypothetical protein
MGDDRGFFFVIMCSLIINISVTFVQGYKAMLPVSIQSKPTFFGILSWI